MITLFDSSRIKQKLNKQQLSEMCELLKAAEFKSAGDTLFHHLFHTLLPEQTTHRYHLRSRTHSFKLSSQHDERNFIDRMLFKNANPVCTQ